MEITKNTPVAELLSSDVDIGTLLDLLPVRNELFGQKLNNLINTPYQKVMTIINLVKDKELIKAFEILTGKTEQEILSLNCQDFLCASKWLNKEIEQIYNLLNSLSNDQDEDSFLLQASGIDKLDKYGEIIVYYNIDKNPTKWEEIGNLPFSTIFTKLSIDRDMSIIEKNYQRNLRNKK